MRVGHYRVDGPSVQGILMKFCEVTGHSRVAEVLRRAVDTGRVPPTILFHGRNGVGKRTMAMAFVSYLICQDRHDGDSCGVCSNCRRMAEGGYVDLVVIEPEKATIKIDQVREAMPRLLFEPVIGPFKFLLIDDAHTMSAEAANAALKTLEEPPSNTIFILVTSSPDVLPRTVLSRSFMVPFCPVSAGETVDFLVSRRGVEPDTARSAAALSGGCPGEAVRLLESEVLKERQDFIRSFLGLAGEVDGQTGAPVLATCSRLEFSDGLPSEKDGVDGYRLILETVAQDVLKSVAGVPVDALCNFDMAEEIAAFAATLGPDRAVAMAEAWIHWDLVRRYTPMTRNAVDGIVLSMS
jgi:DNA polymerase-3 subunit delta'